MSSDGVWVCQTCSRPTLKPYTSFDSPTCGQREELYCQLCQNMRMFQFSEPLRDEEHLKWVVERQKRLAAGVSNRQVDLADPVVFEGEGVRNFLPQPAAFMQTAPFKAEALHENTCSTPSLPLFVGREAIARYIASHHPTEKQLGELRTFLHNVALPEIEKAQRELSLCLICMERPKSVVVLPCKHRPVCQQCMVALRDQHSPSTQCPLCREVIADFIVPYD